MGGGDRGDDKSSDRRRRGAARFPHAANRRCAEAQAGVQIMTLPQLAARLAGGFTRPARSQDLDPAIRSALEAGGFADLESIRELPGMTRSVAWTLTRVWNADFALADRAHESARLRDLTTIEARVRASLPAGVLTPRDLRDAALQRVTSRAGGSGLGRTSIASCASRRCGGRC